MRDQSYEKRDQSYEKINPGYGERKMGYGKREIEKIMQYYIDIRYNYMSEFRKCPNGSLTCSKENGRNQFMYAQKKNGTYVRQGINRNSDMISCLARKKFLERSIKEIDQNIQVLNKAINEFRDCDSTDIVNSMPRAYKKLPMNLFFNPVVDELFSTNNEIAKARYERHREWAEAPYPKSDYMIEMLTEVTSRGELIRTKSEVLVAELLYKNTVPFRYEDATNLQLYGVIPDFEFETRNKSLLFLEYCGMMDNPDYVENYLRKRRLYEDFGIYEWKNIIYIFESENKINMPMIDTIIKQRIIPLL